MWNESVCVTYWTHSAAVCILMKSLTHLQMPTLAHLTPSYVYMYNSWYYNSYEKTAQNPAVLAMY